MDWCVIKGRTKLKAGNKTIINALYERTIVLFRAIQRL